MKKLAIKENFPTIDGEPLKIIFIVAVADVTWADVKGLVCNQLKTKIKHLTNFLEWPLLLGEGFNLNNLSKFPYSR